MIRLSAPRRWRTAAPLFLAASIAPLLSGCVAAALPVIAAGGLVSTRGDDRDRRPQSTPRVAIPADAGPAAPSAPGEATIRQASFPDGSTVVVTNTLARPAAGSPTSATAPGESVLRQPGTEQTVRLAAFAAMPPPTAADLAAGAGQSLAAYAAFGDFVARQAALPAAGAERRSAILRDSSTMQPTTRECSIHPAAVLVDLDPAGTTFDPDGSSIADPAFADRLASLRDEGVTIGWISSRTADRAGAVRKALRTSGLDPAGRDELVLLRFPEERKQTRRDDFAKAYCVVAMAGDERSDFDELFAYLRDPAVALPLEKMVGQGWFILPPPIR